MQRQAPKQSAGRRQHVHASTNTTRNSHVTACQHYKHCKYNLQPAHYTQTPTQHVQTFNPRNTVTNHDVNLQHALAEQIQAAADSSTRNAAQSATPSHPTQDIQRKINKLTRHFQAQSAQHRLRWCEEKQKEKEILDTLFSYSVQASKSAIQRTSKPANTASSNQRRHATTSNDGNSARRALATA